MKNLHFLTNNSQYFDMRHSCCRDVAWCFVSVWS